MKKLKGWLLKSWFFYLTVFVTGGVILVIEILGTRILAPFYGSTIFVWSSLISVTLGFLALGYFFGGKLADKKPDINLLYWIILVAALFILIIPKIDKFILLKTDFLGIRWGPLFAAFFLFSIPLLLLGTVSPFALRVKTKTVGDVGKAAGNLYAISTLGSLAGGLLAGFYLVPNFPVNSIIIFLGLILISLFLLWQLLVFLK